ncbi:inositol-tetrakisphosphate 1-kinase 6-like [Lolium rigidum]|uniref:inositol-tetrakisphosphate 1-kinase 6-like n=1 Tax=Lolium rigidum TaxID=89674 RepID=UPI001F5C7393|nr:inositol-tetrakisphosphate 1-kinase 6-like [Lolium rigidum]
MKNSMPNASLLKSSSGDKALTFNRLFQWLLRSSHCRKKVQDNKSLNIMQWKKLQNCLTSFGFDVVVQEGNFDAKATFRLGVAYHEASHEALRTGDTLVGSPQERTAEGGRGFDDWRWGDHSRHCIV